MGMLKGVLNGGVDMDAFDLFDVEDADVKPQTLAERFGNSRRGFTFPTENGQVWRVLRDDIGHQKRLVVKLEEQDHGGTAFWAEVVDGHILISKLSKNGAYRAVGKPIART